MDTASTDGTRSCRYERKFIVPLHMVQNLASILRYSSFGFKEIFAERIVNNIYFDTPMFRFYNENVQGVAERKKLRIRWYGDTTLAKECRFEIKRKVGAAGFKDVFPISLQPGDLATFSFSNTLALPEDVKLQLAETRPALFNRYRRRYFLSADERFRATMDYDLRYSHPSVIERSGHFGSLDGEAVLELKYNHEFDMDASPVVDEFPFFFSKKSKYVSGIDEVYSH